MSEFYARQASIWTTIPGLTEELTRCVVEKMSAGEAAFALSHMAGQRISRNAAIGAAKRRGMQFHSVPPKKSTSKRPSGAQRRKASIGFNGGQRQVPFNITRQRAPSGPEPIVEVPKPADFLGLTILEVKDSQCKFSHSDSSPYLFCGQPVEGESSWCPYHFRVVCVGFGIYHNPVNKSESQTKS